jgi:hypothetical protein
MIFTLSKLIHVNFYSKWNHNCLYNCQIIYKVVMNHVKSWPKIALIKEDKLKIITKATLMNKNKNNPCC